MANKAIDKAYLLATLKDFYNKILSPFLQSKPAASGGTDLSLVTTGDKYRWDNTTGSGTVTNVATGAGLTGGPVTSTGTIKANLVDETPSSQTSETITTAVDRQYAVNLDSNNKLSVNVPWSDTTYSSKAAVSGGTDESLVTTGEKYTWNQKVSKSSTAGLLKNDGTVDTSTYLKAADITGKADKVASATSGNFAGLDANGNLTDSGSKASDFSTVKTSKTAASSGTDLSLVTTGEKYTWNQKVGKSSTAGLLKNDGTVDTTSYAASANAYVTGDTAETALADGDYFPFYDTSATGKRKTLWSNIKSVLKTYFDTLYSTVKTSETAASGGTTLSLVTTGEKYTWNSKAGTSVVSTSANGLAPKITSTSAFLKGDGTWATPSNTVPTAYCSTAAGTAAKTASCTNYALLNNSYINVLITTANTAQSALTLSINGKTVTPIFINGSASSASNYTLPAGSYFVYYDGTNYYFRTDGKITGSITGDAATVNGKTVAENVPSGAKFTDTTYTFDGTYNASTNKAATVSTVTNAIGALDGAITGSAGTGKTLSAFSQTDGKVTATFSDISITKSQVSDFPSSMTPSSHTHGNIQNGGTLQTNDITIANGDKLIVTDSSDSSKVARTSIAFDGSTTSQALSKKGTWVTYLTSHQTVKQDGVTGATVNRFGTCSTAAATAAKTVSITTGTFALEAGATVAVKFSNKNTADSPTLAVGSTDAKNIFVNGAQITNGGNKGLLAGTVVFIYDGTQYNLIGNYHDTNTTYSSKTAASGGTDVSLCTTGEKYIWNNKPDLGTSATTAAKGNHTHAASIAADSGTSALSMAANTKYKLTAGGSTFIFTTPPDSNTNNRRAFYGTCSTAAGTQVKAVTLSDTTGWELAAGVIVGVKFTNTNTYESTTTDPCKLNVNSTGDKNIYYANSATPTGTNTTAFGQASYINYYMYDGTNWVWLSRSTDNNTTYSAMSQSEANTGTATTSRTITAAVLATTISNKIGALDGSITGSAGAGKTLTAFSQTDGKVTATFGNISITKSQVSDFPTSMTPTSHTHGNITNDGKLQSSDITIASGDKLVVTDSSDSSKVARTSISFDGSTTTQVLSKKGTWVTNSDKNVYQEAISTGRYNILLGTSTESSTAETGTAHKRGGFWLDTARNSLSLTEINYQEFHCIDSTWFMPDQIDGQAVIVGSTDPYLPVGTTSVRFKVDPVNYQYINGAGYCKFAYEPYIEVNQNATAPSVTEIKFSTVNNINYCTVKFTAITSTQAGGDAGQQCHIRLRRLGGGLCSTTTYPYS